MDQEEVDEELFSLNPLDLNNVVAHILSYVGTNSQDLLNYRLVNHTWNEVAVELLKSNGFIINLDSWRKAADYNQLLLNSKEERTTSTEFLHSMNCKLSLQHEVEFIVKQDTFPNIFVPWNSQSRSGNLNFLYEILQSTSSRLESLDLNNQIPLVESKCQLSFPVLVWMRCYSAGTQGYFNMMRQIIQFTSSLQTLVITNCNLTNPFSSPAVEVTQIPFSLKELLAVNTLTTIELTINNASVLKSFCQVRCPKLKTLVIHERVTCILYEEFGIWLTNHAPCLESIHFYILTEVGQTAQVQAPQTPASSSFSPNLFPSLQNIKSLGLYFMSAYRNHDIITPLAIICKHFPNLQAMTTNILTVAILADQLKNDYTHVIPIKLPQELQPIYSKLEFPSISCLTMTINQSTLPNVRFFTSLYPNLKKIIFGGPSVTKIIESKLNIMFQIPGIQSLEIQNYTDDWLGSTINGENNHWLDLWSQSLTHLKLARKKEKKVNGKKEKNGNYDTGEIYSKPSLASILDKFPRLETIQIDNGLMRDNNDQVPFDQVLSELHVLKYLYNNINIILI